MVRILNGPIYSILNLFLLIRRSRRLANSFIFRGDVPYGLQHGQCHPPGPEFSLG